MRKGFLLGTLVLVSFSLSAEKYIITEFGAVRLYTN